MGWGTICRGSCGRGSWTGSSRPPGWRGRARRAEPGSAGLGVDQAEVAVDPRRDLAHHAGDGRAVGGAVREIGLEDVAEQAAQEDGRRLGVIGGWKPRHVVAQGYLPTRIW